MSTLPKPADAMRSGPIRGTLTQLNPRRASLDFEPEPLQVVSNIPIPDERRNCKYPFAEMQVGDSFYSENSVHALQSTISNRRGRNTIPRAHKFLVKREGTGCRVWRIAGILCVLVLSAVIAQAAVWTHPLKCEVSDPTATHATVWRESVSSGKRSLDQQVPIDFEQTPLGSAMTFTVKKPAPNAAKWNYYCGYHRDANEETGEPAADVIREDVSVQINWKLKPEGQ